VPGVESARSLTRGSVGHNTRATQVRGIRAANTRATEQSQDGGTGNRPDARALIPVVQDDFPPSDRSHRRAGDAVLPAGRRIRAGVAGAAGQPLRSRPADSDHAGGTHDRRDRRHPAPGGVAAADRPGPGRDWTTPTSSRHPSRSASSRTSCSSSPSSPLRPHGREQAVVFTGPDAASRFQRRSSAAPALFLIVGTGTAAERSLKWRGLIGIHGGPPAWRRCRFSDRGNAGLV
jgi:hypothetical protein